MQCLLSLERGRSLRSHRYCLALALLALLALNTSLAFAQSRIGSAATVTNQVEGILRGSARSLAAGSDVHANELVRTQDASVAELVFLDNTNLSIGPRSSVTLDRFVYDPDGRTGRVVVNATRGVFRFVTGSQPPQNYTIRTPIATIGVRGTVFDLLVESNRIVVVLVSGEVIVSTAGRSVRLSVPGTAVTVYAGGRVVGPSDWAGQTIRTASGAPFPYFGGYPIASAAPGFMMGGWHPFIGVEGGFASTDTDFVVAPPFNVHGTPGVIGINGGLMYMPPGTNFFFGPRVGALFGSGSGSIADPPASPGFTYKVEMPWTVYYEGEAGIALNGMLANARLHGSLGAATVNTKVTGTSAVLTVSSSVTCTGFTASGGIDFPVMQNMLIGAQFRYINAPTDLASIPGMVPISSNTYVGTDRHDRGGSGSELRLFALEVDDRRPLRRPRLRQRPITALQHTINAAELIRRGRTHIGRSFCRVCEVFAAISRQHGCVIAREFLKRGARAIGAIARKRI